MPTPKQEKLAEQIIENSKRDKPLTAKEMLVNVGYATSVAESKPNEIIEAEGVTQALEERGFSVVAAKDVVGEILEDPLEKATDRLKAADMVFKVHGSYAPDKAINVNLNAEIIAEETLDKLATKINEQMKNELHQRTSEPGDGVASNAVDSKVQD